MSFRPDHNLQDLIAKIYPLKRRNVKAPEPAKRKEGSMSSLAVTKTKVSAQAGRRTKVATRKELPDKDCDEPWDSKLDWNTLKFLVEVANRTKPMKSSASRVSGSKSEQASASHKRFKPRVKDHKSEHGDHTTSETASPKRLPRTQRRRPATTFGDSRNSSQPDESSAERERRNGPVWFSLVASTDHEGKTSLPQIPTNFLRIRDGNIPVSFIHKYLMKKLDLQSETQVEIRCMGEAVIPTLKFQKLVDIWLQRSSKRQKFDAWIGSSAKDYMMVLAYGRKLPDRVQ